MPVLETDFLVALINKRDFHHTEAVQYLERSEELRLSPYAILELDLMILSRKLEVADYQRLFEYLGEALALYDVVVEAVDLGHFPVAKRLRERYGLTYFDSLHASVAILIGEPIVSYDRAYSSVEGLKHIDPRKAL